jgi:hypothetical protein
MHCKSLNEPRALGCPYENKALERSAMTSGEEPNMSCGCEGLTERLFIEVPFAAEGQLIETQNILNQRRAKAHETFWSGSNVGRDVTRRWREMFLAQQDKGLCCPKANISECVCGLWRHGARANTAVPPPGHRGDPILKNVFAGQFRLWAV